MLAGSVGHWAANVIGEDGKRTIRQTLKVDRLVLFQRGEEAVKQDPLASGQRLKIGNDSAGHHLFGGKYHLKGEESDVVRTKTDNRSSGR